jgi:putative thiamine transport system ATP-binding protein
MVLSRRFCHIATLACELAHFSVFIGALLVMLEINNIEFSYDRPLVTGLSFCVPAGEIRLLHGISGSGKSTLLSLICGTPDPALVWRGTIRLGGVDIVPVAPHQRRIGLMYQDPLLFPHMSVADNLAFGLAATVRGDERAMVVAAALTAAGLDGFGGRDPASLSGGQAARVALMRALLADPKALLLDEAFSSLDPDLRQQFGGFVADQIKSRKIPALLVSHDRADRQFSTGAVLHLDAFAANDPVSSGSVSRDAISGDTA